MKIELRAPGWLNPYAFADDYRLTPIVSDINGVQYAWDRWDFPSLQLSPQAGLLLVQGMKLQKIFDRAIIQVDTSSHYMDHSGPFLFVKGDYRPYNAPPRITGVVLAGLGDVPISLSAEQVVGAVVQVALAT